MYITLYFNWSGSVFYNINHVRPIKRLNSIGFKGTFENGPGSVEAALSINKRLLLFKVTYIIGTVTVLI